MTPGKNGLYRIDVTISIQQISSEMFITSLLQATQTLVAYLHQQPYSVWWLCETGLQAGLGQATLSLHMTLTTVIWWPSAAAGLEFPGKFHWHLQLLGWANGKAGLSWALLSLHIVSWPFTWSLYQGSWISEVVAPGSKSKYFKTQEEEARIS